MVWGLTIKIYRHVSGNRDVDIDMLPPVSAGDGFIDFQYVTWEAASTLQKVVQRLSRLPTWPRPLGCLILCAFYLYQQGFIYYY